MRDALLWTVAMATLNSVALVLLLVFDGKYLTGAALAVVAAFCLWKIADGFSTGHK